jgi:5'-methylthioadenosine phosphorylase
MNAIGIIGGTGLYEIDGLSEIRQLSIDTPFGSPSSVITTGVIGNSKLAFIARHGKGHVLLPSEINSRANIYALKSLGVKWCISVSAVGSLQEQYAPGDVVLPDQYIDRTRGRRSTFFGEGIAAHVPFADPVCPVLREVLFKVSKEIVSSQESVSKVHSGGTYVCMEGPQFSTRAESNLYRSWGASLIGMTALPEAKLAREAELAYATLALVTDYDCWRQSNSDVDIQEILAVMKKNVELSRKIIAQVIEKLENTEPSSMAANALAMGIITPKELIPENIKASLEPIIGKYL